MQGSSVLHQLARDHRAMEAHAERVYRLLDAATPALPRLSAARWSMARVILQHMTLQDRHLYARLAADSRPAIAALGRRYQDDFSAQLARYSSHAQHWTAARLRDDWNGYRARAAEQLHMMACGIFSVERELFPIVRAGLDIEEAHTPCRSWARDAFAIKDSVSA